MKKRMLIALAVVLLLGLGASAGLADSSARPFKGRVSKSILQDTTDTCPGGNCSCMEVEGTIIATHLGKGTMTEVACVDLDTWAGTTPDPASLSAWFDALADTGADALLRSLRALDPELVVMLLKARATVVPKPVDEEGWQPPAGTQTLDGQFFFAARTEGDDLATVVQMLRTLFERDYWMYFRMMQGVLWELDTENEEWALRWRTMW